MNAVTDRSAARKRVAKALRFYFQAVCDGREFDEADHLREVLDILTGKLGWTEKRVYIVADNVQAFVAYRKAVTA